MIACPKCGEEFEEGHDVDCIKEWGECTECRGRCPYCQYKERVLEPHELVQAKDAYAGRPDEKDGNVLFSITGKFNNGFEMDVKIPNCRDVESNGGENYIDYVLFDPEGHELSCGYSDHMDICGEYQLECDGTQYTFIIKEA